MFKIILGKDLIFEEGTLSSSFCVLINGHYFPDKEWDDFSFSIIYDWLYLLMRLSDEKQSEDKLYFMEGLYYLDVSCVADHMLQVQTNENTQGKSTSILINFDEFLRELLHAAQQLIESIQETKFIQIEGFENFCQLVRMINEKISIKK